MLQGLLPNRNSPRWLVFIIDLLIVSVSLLAAYLLRFDSLDIPWEHELPSLKPALPIFLLIRALTFIGWRTYRGIVRYTSTQDAKRIFLAVTSGTIAFLLLSPLRYEYYDGLYFLPISILLIEYILTLVLLIGSRILVKLAYLEAKKVGEAKVRVVIFGAGESGLITKRTLDREGQTNYKVLCFFDDDRKKAGKMLEGVMIRHASELENVLANSQPEQLIISIQNADQKRISEVVNTAIAHNVEVLNVPPVNNWINGQLSYRQIRKVRIEDLLGREEFYIDNDRIGETLCDKTVLVTGAAGSIGSGLVWEIVKHQPTKVVLLDQAESPLYDLEFALRTEGFDDRCEVVVGDITNAGRMRKVMEHFSPQIIFHAAAYKHVPMMELNPTEAVRTNIGGTVNLVDLSINLGVEKFIMVSTDKAVNPTNVMGATKRTAEIYAQSSTGRGQTQFITTRFGNVLGSNGSVIPVFRKQIEAGGPVTVTDPEVTRYFMTIPEACQLVLEAATMGENGEILIFDMGKAVRIDDLARKMIHLSGMEIGKDIEVRYTGLRPGEKLYEELLNNEENTVPTHHPLIMRARVRQYDFQEVENPVKELVEACEEQNNTSLVRSLKSLVPEFVSKNSDFEELDEKDDT